MSDADVDVLVRFCAVLRTAASAPQLNFLCIDYGGILEKTERLDGTESYLWK